MAVKSLTLLEAARVFNFVVPEALKDEEIIGQIRSTLIYAGEMRRLNAAIAATEAAQARGETLRRWPDPEKY